MSKQPQAAQVPMIIWMQRPAPIPGCPPGLEYLTQLDQIQMEQIPSMIEAFTGFDTKNKYVLRNGIGHQFLYAGEESDTCERICCGPQRAFTIHLIDSTHQEVLRISREFKCCAGCFWFAGSCDCCAHEITVEAPPGNVIGYVKQKGSCWGVACEIQDAERNCILEIKGPCLVFDGPCCPADTDFMVVSPGQEVPIGKISKHYAGFVQEMFTNADHFGIYFPLDLSVKAKAVLIAATFLMDFMFFQRKQN